MGYDDQRRDFEPAELLVGSAYLGTLLGVVLILAILI